jgi:hypothetical protein
MQDTGAKVRLQKARLPWEQEWNFRKPLCGFVCQMVQTFN